MMEKYLCQFFLISSQQKELFLGKKMRVNKATKRTQMSEIERAFNKKQYQKCQTLLQSLLEDNENDPTVYFWLGKTQMEINHISQGVNYMLIAIDLDPDNFRWYNGYAQSLIDVKRLEEAEEILRESFIKKKDNVEGYFLLAKVCFINSRFNEAKEALERCLILTPAHQQGRKLRQKVDQILQKRQKQKKLKVKKTLFLQNQSHLDQRPSGQKTLLQQTDETNKQRNMIEQLQLKISQLESKCMSLKSENQAKYQCKICFDDEAIYMNSKCKHLCLCDRCVQMMRKVCPICKAFGPFERIYL